MFQQHDYKHGNNFSGYTNPLARNEQPDAQRPLLIAFTGKLGSGKSTAAKIINDTYGGVKISFARALKLEVYDVLSTGNTPGAQSVTWKDPVNDTLFEGNPIPRLVMPSDNEKVAWIDQNKKALRPLLQYYGTEYRRAQNKNYWIDQCVLLIEKAIHDGECVITVDDLRFRNEAEALADVGFHITKVSTGDSERVTRVASRDGVAVNASDSHASEIEQDGMAAHYYINNSMEVHMMQSQLMYIVHDILNTEA